MKSSDTDATKLDIHDRCTDNIPPTLYPVPDSTIIAHKWHHECECPRGDTDIVRCLLITPQPGVAGLTFSVPRSIVHQCLHFPSAAFTKYCISKILDYYSLHSLSGEPTCLLFIIVEALIAVNVQ